MSALIPATGQISDFSEMQSKKGNTFYKIKFLTSTGEIQGTTFDNPADPVCNGTIAVLYSQTQNGRFLNTLFYLPNHVNKDGSKMSMTPQRGSDYNPYAPKIDTWVQEQIIKAITEHEKKFHQGTPI